MVTDEPFLAPLSFSRGDLTLRAYRPGDGAAVQAATIESYEHLRPWMPWAKTDYALVDAETTVRRLGAKYLLNEDFALGLWRGDRLVGGSGFHLRHGPIAWGAAEIGMWIRGDESGRGLGTEALSMMLEWGFGEWGWSRLVWRCDVNNFASARVAEKAGLTREGILRSESLGVDGARRDMALYAIVKGG